MVLAISLATAGIACGGGKAAYSPDKATSNGNQPGSQSAGKPNDWCDPMPQPDDHCTTELKECMVTCDYISDRCALLVCMGSKWTYVEQQEEKPKQ